MACHPLVRHLRERVRAGDFGVLRQLVADLGWVVDKPPTDRMFAPELGGGALLDMGVYPLTLAHLFLGEPAELTAVAHLAETRIDLNLVLAARYHDGAVAAMTTSMTSNSPRTATIASDTGRLDFHDPFHHPSYVRWTPYDGSTPLEPERIEPPEPVLGLGYANEAAEVMRCLRAGEKESPLVPLEQTLTLMRQMDAVRAQLGSSTRASSPGRVGAVSGAEPRRYASTARTRRCPSSSGAGRAWRRSAACASPRRPA